MLDSLTSNGTRTGRGGSSRRLHQKHGEVFLLGAKKARLTGKIAVRILLGKVPYINANDNFVAREVALAA